MLLKDILKKGKKISHSENGKVLLKDLQITFEIMEHLKDYPDTLAQITRILLALNGALNEKDRKSFEEFRIQLESVVFAFDREHDGLLYNEMGLIERMSSHRGK